MKKEASNRQRIWNSMRIMQRFTIAQIVTTSEVSLSVARHYINTLQATGYLKMVRAQDGKAGGYAIYQLVRNTGPKHPKTNPVQVALDQNNNEFYLPDTRKGELIREWLDKCAEDGC